MTHDERLVASDDRIEEFRGQIPEWIQKLERPPTPAVMPAFGPLAGLRAVGTGVLIAQPYIGTKLAEFGAEVIHIERAGGDPFRTTAPLLTRGPRPHGADEADVAKNKLSMGVDLKQARGVELLMALWKISDVWMESSAPGTCERNGICNELALAVNPRLVIVRVSTYGQYGQEDYLGRPGYDALAQAYGGMMNVTGDPAGPPQRAKVFTGDYITALTGWAATMMALWEVNKSGRGQVIDLAQYEAVAQTQGNCLPLYTGEGVAYGHTGNKAPGFQPYDTFQCLDGWVFIGCLGPVMFARVARLLGLDPDEYSYEACSKDAAAVNSDKGREVDQRLREFCAVAYGPRRRDDPQQGADRLLAGVRRRGPVPRRALPRPRHDRPRRRSPIRGADPRLRRGAQDVTDTGPHLARGGVDRRGHHRHPLDDARPVGPDRSPPSTTTTSCTAPSPSPPPRCEPAHP